jgi:hypothetical protein
MIEGAKAFSLSDIEWLSVRIGKNIGVERSLRQRPEESANVSRVAFETERDGGLDG